MGAGEAACQRPLSSQWDTTLKPRKSEGCTADEAGTSCRQDFNDRIQKSRVLNQDNNLKHFRHRGKAALLLSVPCHHEGDNPMVMRLSVNIRNMYFLYCWSSKFALNKPRENSRCVMMTGQENQKTERVVVVGFFGTSCSDTIWTPEQATVSLRD